MSTFKMGFKNLFVFTALLLVCKVCRVYGNAARVEYINQPYCTSSVGTCVQATPKLVVPATFTPVVSPCDSYSQESVPTVPSYNGFNGYSNYATGYPQSMPPIIIIDDNDDNWQNILYFLLFAMRNKRNCGSGNFGGCSGGYNGGCGCGGGCNGGCGGCIGGCNGGCGCGGNSGGSCCCNCGSNCCCNCGGNCCCNCGGNCCCNCGGNCCCNGGGNCCCNCCCNCGGCCCCNNNLGSCCSYIPYPIPYPMSGPYCNSFPGLGGYGANSLGSIEEPYQPGQGNSDITVHIKSD